jgi:very-short-patch-repair endonuclease
MVSHPVGKLSAVGKYDEHVMALAGQQHFVVGREQLLEIGTPRQIKTRLHRGTLERVFESVYRVAGSPKTWRRDLTAATFAGGKLSVASFRSAAALQYLPGGEEFLEITSQRHRRARHEGVIAHESRHLTELDVMYIDNIPVTRPARTINDLGLLVETGELAPKVLDHALHDAIRRNLVDVARVWREWERLGGTIRPGGKAIERLLKHFVPPKRDTDSSPEIQLLQYIRIAGLPEPVPQFRVWLSPTQWVDLDFSWPLIKIFFEFDSFKYHGNRDKYMRDAERRLKLREQGWDVIVVTDDELDSGCKLAMSVARQLIANADGRR